MSVADNVRKIGQEAEPAIERWLDAAEVLTGLRDVAKESGLNWSALKALLVAKVRDNKDGGDRVQKMAEKLDVALEYAFMLSDRGGTKNVPTQSTTAPNPHKSPPERVSVAAGNVIPLDATSQATTRRPIPPARHDPLITPSAPGTTPQSVASDSSLTTCPPGDGEAATTSALVVASSFLCTACGAEREEAETLCWSCRAADLPEYRVSDSDLVAGSSPSVARDRPLNRKDDGDAATNGSAVAASTNPTVGTSPTNDDDFNRIPDVLNRNRVTA